MKAIEKNTHLFYKATGPLCCTHECGLVIGGFCELGCGVLTIKNSIDLFQRKQVCTCKVLTKPHGLAYRNEHNPLFKIYFFDIFTDI